MLLAVVFLAVLPTASAGGEVLVPGDWIRDGDGGWISPNLVRNPSVEEGRQGKPTAWSLERHLPLLVAALSRVAAEAPALK